MLQHGSTRDFISRVGKTYRSIRSARRPSPSGPQRLAHASTMATDRIRLKAAYAHWDTDFQPLREHSCRSFRKTSGSPIKISTPGRVGRSGHWWRKVSLQIRRNPRPRVPQAPRYPTFSRLNLLQSPLISTLGCKSALLTSTVRPVHIDPARHHVLQRFQEISNATQSHSL